MSRKHSALQRAAVAAALAVSLSVLNPAGAQVPAPSFAELERNFWACDYAATQALLDFGSAMTCSVIHEQFKKVHFNGDFHALYAYWKRNKDAEYRKLDAIYHARASDRDDVVLR